jgi:predicted ATPase/transcriptional regulator with GAF, ATPase, and Fis domain
MVIPGYEAFQELARTDRCSIGRARRSDDRKNVLLKLPLRNPPSLSDLNSLEREFEILNALSSAGMPEALEMRRDKNCCLVLADDGAVPLQMLLARQRPTLEQFFEIGIRLCLTLAELRRRNIIHLGLNDQSVWARPDTCQPQIVDFSFASRSSGETQSRFFSPLSKQMLPFVSPEQTGRMNRSIDYRTDFYSLGVLFYEILTGACPFQSDDSLELIHCHIARSPRPPAEIDAEIPGPVSSIVMKLLAKTAEERYQSADGIKKDLEICAREWAAGRRIAAFPLAHLDVSDRFLISQKLYGRDREVEELIEAFDCAREGPATMMVVAGYSGIGKTSLIQELRKPIVRQRGYFIEGKFDQIARTPYGAFIQAFRELCRQLLTESEEQLALWRARLSDALGSSGGVIAEVIPEIEMVTGPQPPASPLASAEAQNRFRLVFQNFVEAFARKEHPLAIFLDDLQWADSATLNLLQSLLASGGIQRLFLIGSYRDNEVDAAHPLSRTLGELEQSGIALRRVALGPLPLEDLTLLISDTIHREAGDVEPLARLVLQKTGGNPFFVIQFLEELARAKLLEFDYKRGMWVFQIEAISAAGMTDNVIDLMIRRIRQLSSKAQAALTLGACIGNQFDLDTLAIVSRQSRLEAAADLGEALDEGLILPVARAFAAANDSAPATPDQSGEVFAFLHDRAQQAAYALIPDEQKQLVHLTVGRLLLEKWKGDLPEDKSFDIVNHLNLGSSLITDQQERLALARLNLGAGRKAKTSTAFEAALGYFKSGIASLSEKHWQTDYDLMLALNLEAAECQCLCGKFDEAEQKFEPLLERAATSLDKARVYRLRSVQCENMSRYEDAVAIARQSLALFGVAFPDTDEEKQEGLEAEIASIQSLLDGRSIDSLIELPVMTDPEIRTVMDILTYIWSSTYIIGDVALARLISALMVRLSLVHGNCEESAYGYVTHAITVGPALKDYKSAYEFGRLALGVNERFNDSTRRAKIYQQFHAHVNLWRQPLETCVSYAREACRSGLETGDFLYAAYGASTGSWHAFASTRNLAQFISDYSPNLALIKKLKIISFADSLNLILNWARALSGETVARLSLSDDSFDEKEYETRYRDNPFFTTFYRAARLHLFYIFDEYAKALEAARVARETVYHLSGTIWPVLFDFWHGLALAANYANASTDEQTAYLEELEKIQAGFAILAENCPENFLCHALLIRAEIERATGQELSAIELYEQAARRAEQTGALQYQALSNELAGKLWLARGQAKIAAVFMAEARACYEQWGALAKAQELERKYTGLFARHASERLPDDKDSAPASLPALEVESLDVVSAMKAAQAIAGESELEKLLARLMRIAIENAGAERGCLIFEHDGEAFIQAEGLLDSVEIKLSEAVLLSQAKNLSQRVVNYARRTLESVVIGDARSDDRYATDQYILSKQPRSIMCVPMLSKGRMIGAIYLENNLVANAFTADRVKVAEVIASEAAISLENARLYDEATEEVERRRQAEATLREITEGTASVTGGDFFYSLVRHLATALHVRYAFAARCEAADKARSLAFWKGDAFGENFEYDLAGTPCKNVAAGEICHYPEHLQSLFPKDTELVAMEAESYSGAPIFNASGAIVGHLVVLDDKPMQKDPRVMSALKIFAARAGAELDRLQAEEKLRQALAEVETLKNRLEAENVYLQEEIRRDHHFEEIIGSSAPLLEVLAQLEIVAPTDSTVLIHGETGTGKELIARALHNRSARRGRPMVKVNCAAISAGLVESELFGHVKGAFTGAIERRVGRFELADKGALFLDEVGELPLDTQVKLLRALQEHEFEPVGSNRTVRVDVRIIAATNIDLEEAIRAGRFRQDLYYRLNVFPLIAPALRERRSDIPQLAMFFLSRYSKRFGKKIERISQESMHLLMSYSWPGNVRELQNIIERAVVLSQGNVLRLGRNLFPALESSRQPEASKTLDASAASAASEADSRASDSGAVEPRAIQIPVTLEEVERRHILDMLAKTGWVIEGPNGAAKLLNLHPNTLRSRLKKLGIKRARHEIS